MESTPVNHRREVTGVVFLAFAVILGVSYYLPPSATGNLGLFLRTFGKGLFGVSAYAIPALFIYAALDFILEKRFNVAPKRAMSVLLVMLAVSAVLPVLTVERSAIEALCMDVTNNKPLASRAILRLWESGTNPDILRAAGTEESFRILTGGVIGGSIALGLELLAARTGAIIILVAFIVSQIGLIFNISLSRTATRTAEAIRATTQRASDAIRSGAESLRAFQNSSEKDTYDPASSMSVPAAGENAPFGETGRAHAGFIDMNSTNTPMGAAARSTPYDMDLAGRTKASGYGQDGLSAYAREKPFGSADPLVETDFLQSAREPIPTSQAHAVSEIPGFLRRKEEAEWIDIRANSVSDEDAANAASMVRRIGVDGNEVQAGARYSFDEDESLSEPSVRPAKLPADISDSEAGIPGAASVAASGPVVIGSAESVASGTNSAPASGASANTAAGVEQVVRVPSEKSRERQISIAFPKPAYKAAPSSLLRPDIQDDSGRSSQAALIARGKKLEDTLASFGIAAKVINITHGPAITRFELAPGPGIKVSRIVNLTDDIALAMASVGVRIEAPIPGKSAIGIEIPNTETTAVTLRGLIDSSGFKKNTSPLLAALGRDIPGNPIYCDLAKMPHLMIAGATGSGKSVCINSILISILCKATPDQVKMILIDPKVVELSIYNGIPHLLAPVVTDPKKASNTLNWAVGEMTRRYGLFAETSVRDFRAYNEEMGRRKEPTIPLILIVIDELADLMQVASKEVEETIARLTAMARAAGIHLLIATQRPSVDVITGVIKANIPSRIAFAVSSQVDSRTILDMVGAEKLLGKGDMLYYPQSAAKPQRGQGAFVSDAEVESVIEYLKAQNLGSYDPEEAEAITSASAGGISSSGKESGDEDELLPQAVEIVLMSGCASVSILQRRMNIGYPRAARLIDRMHEKGYIGPFEGSKPRKLLITQSQWLEIQAKGG